MVIPFFFLGEESTEYSISAGDSLALINSIIRVKIDRNTMKP